MQEIWSLCYGSQHIQNIETQLIRVVESQEQVATMELVHSVKDQSILEDLIEKSKPRQQHPEIDINRHYLIHTPFRYPPLPHGSRFGTRFYRGIFYSSLQYLTAFAECAYYRLLFYSGMAVEPPKRQIITQHTSFCVDLKTDKGILLYKEPFRVYQNAISSPTDYAASQKLGVDMRAAGVEAFAYISARDSERGVNFGVYSEQSIKGVPNNIQHWSSLTNNQKVQIQNHVEKTGFEFERQQFTIDGRLPSPAF